MIKSARAITSSRFEPKKQFLTGMVEGYFRTTVFRVEITLDNDLSFTSTKEYATYDLAKKAAKRLERKINDQ